MVSMKNSTVLIVGGSSGIGLASAERFLQSGASVHIAGRSTDRLDKAAAQLSTFGSVNTLRLDTTDARSVEDGMAGLTDSGLDHVVITASQGVHGRFADLAIEDAMGLFDSKFWGPYRVARAALGRMRDGGSITLFSGVLSRRPGVNCSALGSVNGAVEALVRALALELGPRLRVNGVSPGMVRTEAYAGMPEGARDNMYRETGASLPVGRVGAASEIAEAVLFAAGNAYLTGQILDVDGGHMVRQ